MVYVYLVYSLIEVKLTGASDDILAAADTKVDLGPVFNEEWKKCVLKTNIISGTMPVSVAEYSKLFLDEGAPYSLQMCVLAYCSLPSNDLLFQISRKSERLFHCLLPMVRFC